MRISYNREDDNLMVTKNPMHKEDPVILVKHLSKRYRIGMLRTYTTFCESAVNSLKSPLKRLKSFNRQEETFWALKDINLEVNQGEVLGIIGRNGAGKTTLLKILSRITYPTEGEIVLRGRVGSLLEVGTGFHPELSGRENIYFNGLILGMQKKEVEDKFEEIVKFSGVEEFLDTPLKRYSSGMQVRLAFSVAAHLEPEILAVDEVLAVGDAEFQRKCLGKMEEVSGYGRTVLFVSHNLPAVRKLCTRVIVLTNGEISYVGTADDAVDEYLNAAESEQKLNEMLESDRAKSKYVDLKYIRFIDNDGVEAKSFSSDETIHIEIGYVVKRAIKDLLIRLILNDNQGNTVLATVDMDYPDRAGYKEKEPGFYVSRCTIPPNTFGTHTFYLDLIITKRKESPYLIDLRKIASFETLLVHSSTKNYGDMYGTPIRPDFEWKITKVN